MQYVIIGFKVSQREILDTFMIWHNFALMFHLIAIYTLWLCPFGKTECFLSTIQLPSQNIISNKFLVN